MATKQARNCIRRMIVIQFDSDPCGCTPEWTTMPIPFVCSEYRLFWEYASEDFPFSQETLLKFASMIEIKLSCLS